MINFLRLLMVPCEALLHKKISKQKLFSETFQKIVPIYSLKSLFSKWLQSLITFKNLLKCNLKSFWAVLKDIEKQLKVVSISLNLNVPNSLTLIKKRLSETCFSFRIISKCWNKKIIPISLFRLTMIRNLFKYNTICPNN